MKGYLSQIHPVLPVKDVSVSVMFYVEKLGFQLSFLDGEKEPKYAGIVRDEIEIHLQWHDKKEWIIGIDRPMLRIVVDNIEELFEEYKTKSVFHKQTALKNTAWKTLEFAFYELDYNGLTFYKDL